MRAGAFPLLLVLMAGGLAGQEARSAVIPDSVTVGDVFRAAVRVSVPPGSRVQFPDTLAVPEHVEAAARREVEIDSSRTEVTTYTAIYPLAAWRPGEYDLPAANISIELPDGGQRVNVRFPTLVVHSVLPVDSAGIEPQPPKDVIGPSRLIWPLVLGAAALAALLLLLFWLYRRRRPAETFGPFVPPRERAIAELDRIRALGLLEAGDFKGFYSAVSGVLRGYVAALETEWSPDLTTGELERTMASTISAATPEPPNGASEPGFPAVIALLGRADLVKFAGARPTPRTAEQAWSASREWVASFDWPPPQPEPEPEAVPDKERE